MDALDSTRRWYEEKQENNNKELKDKTKAYEKN